MKKRKVRLIPFVVGIDPRVLQDAVKEVETAERDILKVKTLFKDGLITTIQTLAAFVKTYGGDVTNYLPDDNLIDFNYGSICITVTGEDLPIEESRPYREHVCKWVVHQDNYVELWNMYNVERLRGQYPISWDCLLEQACPSTCSFKHGNHENVTNYAPPTLQGFEVYLYE